MKPSTQRLNEAQHQQIEVMVARHVRDLFKRLPILVGIWLSHDLEAGVSVSTWPGCTAGPALYEEVMRSLVALAEERPEALELMRGRTFARALH